METQVLRVLIVGDADLCATLLEQFAPHAGFAIETAQYAEAALPALATNPDLALLDCDCVSARPLLVEARAAGFTGAAIALGGALEEEWSDFDDVAPRPFRFAELFAKAEAVADRRGAQRPPASQDIAIGGFVFRAGFCDLVDKKGARVRLTEKEAAILMTLGRAKGEAVTRDVLLRDIWSYGRSIATRTLETHIHRLRRKLEANPAEPRLLVTGKGGYRLISAPAPDSEDSTRIAR